MHTRYRTNVGAYNVARIELANPRHAEIIEVDPATGKRVSSPSMQTNSASIWLNGLLKSRGAVGGIKEITDVVPTKTGFRLHFADTITTLEDAERAIEKFMTKVKKNASGLSEQTRSGFKGEATAEAEIDLTTWRYEPTHPGFDAMAVSSGASNNDPSNR